MLNSTIEYMTDRVYSELCERAETIWNFTEHDMCFCIPITRYTWIQVHIGRVPGDPKLIRDIAMYMQRDVCVNGEIHTMMYGYSLDYMSAVIPSPVSVDKDEVRRKIETMWSQSFDHLEGMKVHVVAYVDDSLSSEDEAFIINTINSKNTIQLPPDMIEIYLSHENTQYNGRKMYTEHPDVLYIKRFKVLAEANSLVQVESLAKRFCTNKWGFENSLSHIEKEVADL